MSKGVLMDNSSTNVYLMTGLRGSGKVGDWLNYATDQALIEGEML